jgi:hypothetical protein
MPIRHAEWRVRSSHVINFSSYTRAARETMLIGLFYFVYFAFLMLCRRTIPAAAKLILASLTVRPRSARL